MLIERNEFAENIQRSRVAVEISHQRQQIVEHPYGTVKRQWGFDHIMTKRTMKRASADHEWPGQVVGLMMISYNFRRLMNIPGPKELKKALKALLSALFPKFTRTVLFSAFWPRPDFQMEIFHTGQTTSLKSLIFGWKLAV
ncbi:MAG: hypothetical protein U5L96_09240 [Owenweeksia sp.]|nr:hypothetical protein [Owenweeksia sp.]